MKAVQILPTVPMARYGKNPYGDSLYRVVFSDSRTDLLGGKWPDGACEYRESPRYPGIRGQWILEKWCSAEEYAGKPDAYAREQWDSESHLLTCGPYPTRGEYVHCYTFPYAPGDSMVYQVVCALRRSRDLTDADKKTGIMNPLLKQQAEQGQRFEDIYDNAMGPFAHSSTVVSMNQRNAAHYHVRSGFKRASDMPADRWSGSAPLPTRDNFFGTIQRQETVQNLTGEK